jgi:hypothetical protein
VLEDATEEIVNLVQEFLEKNPLGSGAWSQVGPIG